MNNWLYNNEEILSWNTMETPPYGFIYRINNLIDGKFYIGKKQLMSVTTKKLGKKEIALLPTQRGRKVTKKKVTKEMDWQNYWGSCKSLLNDVKNLGEENFKREIIMLCPNKKLLTYYEMYFQIKADVLTTINCYNDNISSHFFRKDFIDLNLEAQSN